MKFLIVTKGAAAGASPFHSARSDTLAQELAPPPAEHLRPYVELSRSPPTDRLALLPGGLLLAKPPSLLLILDSVLPILRSPVAH